MNERLIPYVRPQNYDLYIEPDLVNFNFNGKVVIKIKVGKPTKRIVLNAHDLKINKAELRQGQQFFECSHKVEKNDRLIMQFKKRISRGNAYLEIDFQGTHNNQLVGFYRSKYKDRGKEKYLATTQFEAPYARRSFPCFDEPDMKATFRVKMLVGKDYEAISNMPIEDEKLQGNKKLVTFQTTPLMSTYLLYLGVGEFESIKGYHNNVEVRVVTTRGKKSQGKYALDITIKFLDFFEKYSKVKYPLPKLDMIAIPDFAAGAMENWGAITFREVLLLFDPKKTSTLVKKRIAEVIAHELWHQWSGNLVTMMWWNDLWLNESFATYMGYKAVDHFFPEWRIWEDFVGDETDGALTDDALATTHPIEVKVKSPNEIEEIFDSISYSKGGNVLRMIENYLGEEVFRKGVSRYLKKFKYKNAVAKDLWTSLEKVSHIPIKNVMENWIRQAGYPVIEAHLNRSKLVLRQKRFFNGNDNSLWKIPLVISLGGEQKIKKLFEKKHEEIDLHTEPRWVKINHEQKGFYRVKYSPDTLFQLKEMIINKILSTYDRWGIQNDLFGLTIMGDISVDKYLDFILAYKNEDNLLVLEDIYVNLREIYVTFFHEKYWKSIWNRFMEHMKEPFKRNFSRLGWEPKKNEDPHDTFLRTLCISYLAFSKDKEIIKTGREKFQDLLRGKHIHPDIKASVLGIVASNGKLKDFQVLIKLYEKEKSPEDKIRLLASLSRFEDSNILKKALDYSLSKKVRIQDMRTAIPAISSSPYARKIFFTWVKTNWARLEPLQKSSFIFMEILRCLITSYTGRENEKRIRKFVDAKVKGYKKTKATSFEIMDINTKWLEKNRDVLECYFLNQA